MIKNLSLLSMLIFTLLPVFELNDTIFYINVGIFAIIILTRIESMLFALFMIAVAVCSNYMSSIPEPYGIILYSIFNACVISIFIDRIFRPYKK